MHGYKKKDEECLFGYRLGSGRLPCAGEKAGGAERER